MHAAAYGHEKPLVDPSEPGSQEVNKRVDIVVLSALPAESQRAARPGHQDRARDARGGSTP